MGSADKLILGVGGRERWRMCQGLGEGRTWVGVSGRGRGRDMMGYALVDERFCTEGALKIVMVC